ncbi:DUF4872 domain-containing protein, partial [Nonomuraea sp. NPDC004297]
DVHLVDTGQQGGAVRTSRDSLARARAERGPMTARNRSFTIALPRSPLRWQDRLAPAIRACTETFLAAPIANLGHRGIATAAERVPAWLERAGDPRHDLPRAAGLMERAGTGGALFRALYRDFLGECAELIDGGDLRTGHRLYTEAAARWPEVAALIAKAGESGDLDHLGRAAALLRDLARIEEAAMRALSRI